MAISGRLRRDRRRHFLGKTRGASYAGRSTFGPLCYGVESALPQYMDSCPPTATKMMNTFFSWLRHSPIFRRVAIGMLALAWSSLVFCGEIHDAARSGDLVRVQALLNDHPELAFSRAEYGETPLHRAAFYRHKDVVEVLLANGADVNAKDSGGLTPLHEVVADGIRPWLGAEDQGPKDVMEVLLANGADVNAKDSSGLTPLHMAVQDGRKDLVELLLAHNASVDAQDNDGQTPLFAAAEAGNDAVVELLLAHKAERCPGRLRPDECLQTAVARPDQLGRSHPRFWIPFPEIRDWNSLRVTLQGTDSKIEIAGDGTVRTFGWPLGRMQNCHLDYECRTHIPRLIVKALFNHFRAFYKATPNGSKGIDSNVDDLPSVRTAIDFDGHAKFEHETLVGQEARLHGHERESEAVYLDPLPEAVERAAAGKLWPRSMVSICGWCIAFIAPALIIGPLSRYVLYRLRISLWVKRLLFILVNACLVAALPLLATFIFYKPAPNLFDLAFPWDLTDFLAGLSVYAAVLILMALLYAAASIFLIRANVGSKPARDRGAISS
jgi:uncharacterized protein